MATIVQVDHAKDRRLRVVFDETVVSLSLSSDATFEDIALTLDEFSTRHYGNPVSIDVTFGTLPESFVFSQPAKITAALSS